MAVININPSELERVFRRPLPTHPSPLAVQTWARSGPTNITERYRTEACLTQAPIARRFDGR
jgi:hypothetical protein